MCLKISLKELAAILARIIYFLQVAFKITRSKVMGIKEKNLEVRLTKNKVLTRMMTFNMV